MHIFSTVTSDVPQGSVLGLGLCNIFMCGLDTKVLCMLSMFDGDTKLEGTIDSMEEKTH